MFARISVRSKLVVMVLPAVVCLAAFAGLGSQARLDELAEAEQRAAAATLGRAASTLAHSVQRESVLASIAVADDDPALQSEFAAQRGVTDDNVESVAVAIQQFESKLASPHAGVDLSAEVARLRGQLRLLASARAGGGEPTVVNVVAQYAAASNGIIAAVGRIDVGVGGIGESSIARLWLSKAIQADTETAALASQHFTDPSTPRRGDPQLTRTAGESRSYFRAFQEFGDPASLADFDRTVAAPEFDATTAQFASFASTSPVVQMNSSAAEWPGVVDTRLEAFGGVEARGFERDGRVATVAAADARAGSRLFMAAAVASLLGVTILAIGLMRNLNGSLSRLTDVARQISTNQLPALVAGMRGADVAVPELELGSLESGRVDEFTDVAVALADLSRATLDVAAEQHTSLRQGVSEIFVSLARRNQLLLDRQIQLIDELEANEEDPDQLEHLFRLDHLATRMRRNAESLLVLAGAEAPRGRVRDVSLTDVVRVSIGEVEDFSRVSLGNVVEARTLGSAAVDLAHLLAELLENATQYSPPDAPIEMSGHRNADGSYTITIVDAGVGMTSDRLAEANDVLARPPMVGLAMSRSLGFLVAGTLATRHGIRVTLRPNVDGTGLNVQVVLPVSLISETPVEPASLINDNRPAAVLHSSQAAPPVSVCGWTADGEYVEIHPAGVGHRDPVAPARAQSDDLWTTTASAADEVQFDAQTFDDAAAYGPSNVPGFEDLPITVAPLEDGDIMDVPSIEFEPTWSAETVDVAGAPTRLSHAVPDGEAFEEGLYALLDRDVPSDTDPARPVDGLPTRTRRDAVSPEPGVGPASMANSTRSPDQLRDSLAQFRIGFHAGRDDAESAPGAAEAPTDRPEDDGTGSAT